MNLTLVLNVFGVICVAMSLGIGSTAGSYWSASSIIAGIPNERCTGAMPDWWDGPCMCPLGNDSVHQHDFCSNTTPTDGQTGVEDSDCFTWTGYECFGQGTGKSCGDKIWNCPYAVCDTAPDDPYPESWGCVETSKPADDCENATYGCLNPY